MNRGLVVADRSGQAWSIFKAKNIRQWSGFASFPTPPFQFTHISNLTSLTFDFSSNPVFFFNLQFRLSLQKFWLTATVEALVLILVPISKANIFPQIMHQHNPISNFPIQFQIWIAQGLFVICVAPSFCLFPILTRPQINAWPWNNSRRQIFTNANMIWVHSLETANIWMWFCIHGVTISTEYDSQRTIHCNKKRNLAIRGKLSLTFGYNNLVAVPVRISTTWIKATL